MNKSIKQKTYNPDHVLRLWSELSVMCVYATWHRMREAMEFGSVDFTRITKEMCCLLANHVSLFKVYYIAGVGDEL